MSERHRVLLAQFYSDIQRFLFAAPFRLRKAEQDYSWNRTRAYEAELQPLLEGMTSGRFCPPGISLRAIARGAAFLGDAYSLEFLSSQITSLYNAQSSVPRIGFEQQLDYVKRLNGREFEGWLFEFLRRSGINEVTVTGGGKDQGADLLVRIGPRLAAIQAKEYDRSVGNAAVQEVFAAKAFYACSEAWVVTTSTFTADAIKLAAATGVRLVDGSELLEFPSKLANPPHTSVSAG